MPGLQIHIKHFPKTAALVFWFVGMMLMSANACAQSDLIGAVSEEQILESDHLFKIHTQRYKPDSDALKYLNSYEDSLSLNIFFGFWCRESKKYLPGLVKTLSQTTLKKMDVNYIGVDAEKKFPDSFLKLYNIKYIPTVVILRGNEEVGRIEDAPSQPIEIELVEILKKEKQL